MKKVAIIGVGNVGSSIAHSLIVNRLTKHLMLCDINKPRVWAEREELLHSAAILGNDVYIQVCNYKECFEADIVVVAVSAKYTAGKSRKEYSISSSEILTEIFRDVQDFKGILILVTNPIELMTYFLCKQTELDWRKVMGTGTVLDSFRLTSQMSDLPYGTWCIGEHGEKNFVPKSLLGMHSLQYNEVGKAIRRNNDISNEIMKIKHTTVWGITEATIKLLDAIINNKQSIFPVCHMIKFSFLDDYGCVSYPAVLGKDGIVRDCKIMLSIQEQEQIKEIVYNQRKYYSKLKVVT